MEKEEGTNTCLKKKKSNEVDGEEMRTKGNTEGKKEVKKMTEREKKIG